MWASGVRGIHTKNNSSRLVTPFTTPAMSDTPSQTATPLEMRGVIRCPLCVSGPEFRPMVVHVNGRYICGKCGHALFPGKAEYGDGWRSF